VECDNSSGGATKNQSQSTDVTTSASTSMVDLDSMFVSLPDVSARAKILLLFNANFVYIGNRQVDFEFYCDDGGGSYYSVYKQTIGTYPNTNKQIVSMHYLMDSVGGKVSCKVRWKGSDTNTRTCYDRILTMIQL